MLSAKEQRTSGVAWNDEQQLLLFKPFSAQSLLLTFETLPCSASEIRSRDLLSSILLLLPPVRLAPPWRDSRLFALRAAILLSAAAADGITIEGGRNGVE